MSTTIRLLAILQAFFPLGLSSSPPTFAPIVDLGYSQYQGSVDTAINTTSFLGIRYAAPPLGNLRWAAPQSPPTISGVQQATVQPNLCYQASMGSAPATPFKRASLTPNQSEDCLFLNIFIPGSEVVATPSGGLPVVVWIHGGGYIYGGAVGTEGTDLILHANYGVIVVSIQYRLGVFGMSSPFLCVLKCTHCGLGFLAGEAVKKGGALNAGLLDQNYALQWVQAHIRSFGGDPTKVTIWGLSAGQLHEIRLPSSVLLDNLVVLGAGSVVQHLVAHGGHTQPPLFKAAMTSSTYLPPQYNYNDQIPEILYREVVNGTNQYLELQLWLKFGYAGLFARRRR
ncbi:hypothetical protein AZE42_11559 [Rhizopogon vesiculosus]|uniref:Carboxylic ester hydrolase n=1 Tax=Rhizopogon vesiculosus TaxID=180088 RepID=A0A1J8PY52_9AGAM|nr:hypothetical protein AZE42_11559 [Rhizopogon vesiculosus]